MIPRAQYTYGPPNINYHPPQSSPILSKFITYDQMFLRFNLKPMNANRKRFFFKALYRTAEEKRYWENVI